MAAAPLWPYSAGILFLIRKSEKSADFSNLLFHGRGRNWKMDFICGTTGNFSEDRPLGWDPVAAGNRAGDGMARFVSEEKAADGSS